MGRGNKSPGPGKTKTISSLLLSVFEQAVRLRTAGIEPGDIKEKDFAERLNKIAGIEQQQAIIEELDKSSYYIERNANAKILFHALTIKLYHIIQDKIVFLVN